MPGIVQRGSKPGSPPHVRSILCTPCDMLLPLASNTINQCGGTHRKTRRARQAAADRKTESSSISFICTAHKIPTATMRPSGLKVMYNTQRPRCGYRTGPGRQSKERRKRRERKKKLELRWREKMQQDMEVESHKRKCCCSDQQGVGHQHQQPGDQVQNHFNPLPSPLWCSLWTPPRGHQHG